MTNIEKQLSVSGPDETAAGLEAVMTAAVVGKMGGDSGVVTLIIERKLSGRGLI